jgi:hypothetical protein
MILQMISVFYCVVIEIFLQSSHNLVIIIISPIPIDNEDLMTAVLSLSNKTLRIKSFSIFFT